MPLRVIVVPPYSGVREALKREKVRGVVTLDDVFQQHHKSDLRCCRKIAENTGDWGTYKQLVGDFLAITCSKERNIVVVPTLDLVCRKPVTVLAILSLDKKAWTSMNKGKASKYRPLYDEITSDPRCSIVEKGQLGEAVRAVCNKEGGLVYRLLSEFGGSTQRKRVPQIPSGLGPGREKAGSRERKSKSEKSKSKKSSDRGARFSMLPNRPVEYSSLQNIKGVVVPSGHGKSYLGQSEGWIDIDQLVSPRHLTDITENILDEIASGRSIEDASMLMQPSVSAALRILNPQEPVILMCQTFQLLEALGVECVGGVIIKPEVVMQYNLNRSEHERLLIQKNIEEAFEAAVSRDIEILTGDSIEDVGWYIYNICANYGIPTGHAAKFNLVDEFLRDPQLGDLTKMSLDELIRYNRQGKVSTETVDYFVRKAGLKHYQSYGVSWNDWAKVMSLAESNRGKSEFDDADWSKWPVTLPSISSQIELSEHEDLQFIAQAHTGEHERFIVGLMLHWKMFGQPSSIRDRLLPLYSIRRCHWVQTFTRISAAVTRSGNLCKFPLTHEERELILSMRLLAAGSFESLRDLMSSQSSAFARQVPGEETLTRLGYAIDRFRFCAPTGLRELEPKNRQLKNVIAEAVSANLESRSGDGHDNATFRRIRAKIQSTWSRACIMRDEWSDGVHRLLDREVATDDMAHAIASMLSCDFDIAASGLDWGIRVYGAMTEMILCFLISKAGTVVMQERNGEIAPAVHGVCEDELISRMNRLGVPRTGLFGRSSQYSTVQGILELGAWGQSKTVMLLEMINMDSWMKTDKRLYLTALTRWSEKFSTGEEREVFKRVADSYTVKLCGEKFDTIRAGLSACKEIRWEDGGFECTTTVRQGKIDVVDGVWSGKGKVVIGKSVGLRAGLDLTLHEHINLYACDSLETKNISAYAVYNLGISCCLLLQKTRKGQLDNHATMVQKMG